MTYLTIINRSGVNIGGFPGRSTVDIYSPRACRLGQSKSSAPTDPLFETLDNTGMLVCSGKHCLKRRSCVRQTTNSRTIAKLQYCRALHEQVSDGPYTLEKAYNG